MTCSPQVFSAERVALKDQVYHKKCAVCSSCEKPLFTNNIYMEKNELFCDQCYRSVLINQLRIRYLKPKQLMFDLTKPFL